MELHRIMVSDIDVVGDRRPADAERVKSLAASMDTIGLQTPISVWTPDDGETIRLVAGRHRLEAARLLGWEYIQCVIVNMDEIDRRLWEISENLHRAELTVEERAHYIAEWIRLTENKGAQICAPSPGGAQPHDKGIKRAARELGIERTDAHRAIKIDALPEEVKSEARRLNLDDNQTALLQAAKEDTKEKQIRALREHALRRTAPRPQPAARDPLNDFETIERQVDALMAAWNRAGPEARERFRDLIDRPVADNTLALRA